jgi:alkylhydroperoxidase/carboxymuconolactone decarboxylase family protein YurZ
MEHDERRARLKQEYIDTRGMWDPSFDGILELDPDYFEGYVAFSSVAHRKGVLDPKVREFILIAIDASVTHLHEEGLRKHIGLALKHGATREEIMSVFELISPLGIHTMTLGVPVLLEEAAAAVGQRETVG